MEKIIPFPAYFENRTYATIRKAYETAGRYDKGMTADGDPGNVNISDILTRIIQDCGRFAENYASDVLYTLDHLREIADNKFRLERRLDEIAVIGIRACGVDHAEFVMGRIKDTRSWPGYVHPEQIYRKIYAIRILIDPEYDRASLGHPVTFEMRDITHQILRIEDADMDPEKHDTIRETPLNYNRDYTGIQPANPPSDAFEPARANKSAY